MQQAGTAAVAAVTLLSTTLWVPGSRVEVVEVNADDALVSPWPSEALDSDAAPDCNFWNMTVVYESSACRHFSTFVRSHGSLAPRVRERALRCAAAHETECVISPEIGLSSPMAFVFDASGAVKEYLAPKVVDFEHRHVEYEPAQAHVRISQPDDGAQTKTVLMNSTLLVHYLDVPSRSMKSEVVEGVHAYCIQLLRAAFSDACWKLIE